MLHFIALLHFQSGVFPLDFPSKILHALLLSPICATLPTHLFLPYLIALKLSGQQQQSLCFSLCIFLHPPVSSSSWTQISSSDPFTRTPSVWVVAFFFYHIATIPVGQGFLIVQDSRSHSDTPHSVGLLWTSDQPDAEPSTWQHTTLTTNIHPCSRRYWNPQSQQASGRRPTP